MHLHVQLYHAYIPCVLLYGSETWALTWALQDKVDAFNNMCLRHIFCIPYMDHVTNAAVWLQAGSPPELSQIIQARRLHFFGHVARMDWIRHLTSLEHSKCQSEGCPRIGDVHPDILVIPGYAPWKQISNLLTLSLTQHGNTLRIDNIGSTSWKPIRSSLGHGRDDGYLHECMCFVAMQSVLWLWQFCLV